MKTLTEKFGQHFSDETFVEDIVRLYESDDAIPSVKEFLDRILTELSTKDLLTELYTKARTDGFVVNIPLSDCFFIVSELTSANDTEQNFALDMSVFLSEDSDSRDPSFNHEDIFSQI